MKNAKILIVLIFLTLSQAIGQPLAPTQGYMKSGYFHPFQKSLYDNQSQDLLNLNFPFSLGLGLSIHNPHHKGFYYNLEIQLQSKADSKTEVRQVPFFIGGKYLLGAESANRFHFYGGANLILCWSCFTSNAEGNEVEERKDDHIWGYGIGANLGLIFDISDAVFIGLDLNSNFLVSREEDKYDYGDIKGVDVSLVLGIGL